MNLNSIRLLIINPSKRTDSVTTRIKIVSLENYPIFQTISCAWGDLTSMRTISLNAYTFEVTANLETVIQHLRDDGQPAMIQLDAMCINQADDEGISVQVGLMAEYLRDVKRCTSGSEPPSISASEIRIQEESGMSENKFSMRMTVLSPDRSTGFEGKLSPNCRHAKSCYTFSK